MGSIPENPDRPYLSLLNDIPLPPLIFIMGDHRSGTTLLYKILGATGCFNIVTAYHVIRQNEILFHHVHGSTEDGQRELCKIFERKGLSTRIFDGVAVASDMPEEYGFVLKDAGLRPQLTPKKAGDLIIFSKKMQLLCGKDRPLLLKNPWDYFLNFIQVKEIFPHSKFIFIGRHPIVTINSQLKAARSLFQDKNEYVALVAQWYEQLYKNPLRLQMSRALFSQHFDLGFHMVFRHVVRASHYFLKQITRLPDQEVLKIRYEDLCQEPKFTVDKTLSTLKLVARTEPDYHDLIQPRAIELLPEVKRNQAKVSIKLKRYLAYWKYEENYE